MMLCQLDTFNFLGTLFLVYFPVDSVEGSKLFIGKIYLCQNLNLCAHVDRCYPNMGRTKMVHLSLFSFFLKGKQISLIFEKRLIGTCCTTSYYLVSMLSNWPKHWLSDFNFTCIPIYYCQILYI